MPHINLRVHLVFSTLDSKPHITVELRAGLIAKFIGIAADHGIRIDTINGWTDHLHLLVSISYDQCIEEVAGSLMNESATWINTGKIANDSFSWDPDYYAVSVSESSVRELRNYIDCQHLHHAVRPFKKEMRTLRRLASLA